MVASARPIFSAEWANCHRARVRKVCVDLEAALRDRSGLVIVHGDRGAHRARLTREHEPGLGLPRLQRVVHGHLDRALADLGAAGGTHPALAGERQVEATGQGGVEHGVCWTDVPVSYTHLRAHETKAN